MKVTAIVFLVAVIGSAVWFNAPNASAPTPTPAPENTRLVLSGNAGVDYRGMCLQVSTGYDPVTMYSPLLKEIAALGANSVLISTAGYMEHAKSRAIFVDARKTPSKTELVALLKDAKAQGMRVIFMPILLLSNPRGSEWRGVIDQQDDWDGWWNQYRDFVLYFADIAREGEATGFIVGSELVSTEKYTSQWVRTIEEVRKRFPGAVGYSANWDHYRPIQFWDKLDFVGMTSYYTLADKKSPSVDEIVTRWKPIVEEIAAWQKTVNRPIVMTEVGWCSQEGAAMAPWNYYQNQKASVEGHEEQRRLYEAYLKVWDGSPLLQGAFWWEWTAGAGGKDDYGYSPKGKPAEAVLRQWYNAGRAATSGSPPGATGTSADGR